MIERLKANEQGSATRGLSLDDAAASDTGTTAAVEESADSRGFDIEDSALDAGSATAVEGPADSRGFDIEDPSMTDAPGLGVAPEGTGQEHYLSGEGDLLFAAATSASINAKDANSYTSVLLQVQTEHPEWTLHEVIREVNRQNVNGTNSELAVTEEASQEAGRDVGYQQALVIGNQEYQNFDDLTGAGRDARAMADVYGGKGYEVDYVTDQAGADLVSTIRNAGEGLGEGDEFLLYYAGHAYEKGLLGVDTTKNASVGVCANAELLAATSSLTAAGVKTEVVLDACKTGSAVDQLVDRDAVECGKEELLEGTVVPGEAAELGGDVQLA